MPCIGPSDSSPIIGLTRPEISANQPTHVGGLSLGVPNAFGYCMCQGGDILKDIANSMGYSCASGNTWMEEVTCLKNPYGGPNGGIPRECLKYLEEVVGIEVVDENMQRICQNHTTCPEGTAWVASREQGSLCGCRGPRDVGAGSGNGDSPPPPMCLLVDCSDAGSSSDCCQTVPPAPSERNFELDLEYFDPRLIQPIIRELDWFREQPGFDHRF